MKIIKRIFFIILIFAAVGLLFRGYLYRQLVTYKSLGPRTNYLATDKNLTAYIDSSLGSQKDRDIESIINLGLSITSEQLIFTADKSDIDPNKLIYSKKTHCVGYARFFATTCNYLLEKYNLADTWSAKPQVGQLYFLGTNIHNYSTSAFFKNHDFVTIENKTTGEIFAVDPSISDYLYIDFITYVNENKQQK